MEYIYVWFRLLVDTFIYSLVYTTGMNQTKMNQKQIVKEFVESLEGSYIAKDYSQEAREKARVKYSRA